MFDSSYIEYILEHEKNDPWSFYDLAGCPAEMIRSVIDLASLAREFELVSTMKWVSFDLTPVLAIEEQLGSWTSDRRPKRFASPRNASMTGEENSSTGSPWNVPEGKTGNSEEELNHADDERHCVEAWRQALLIYIRRVFRIDEQSKTSLPNKQRYGVSDSWGRDSSHKQQRNGSRLWSSGNSIRPNPSCCSEPSRDRIPFYALVRSTLNDIRCVRKSSQTQKQLLLPAFIAGSETSDPELRRFICAYCDWWSDKSRYKMFDTVSKLLPQIWDEVDKSKTSAGAAFPGPGFGTFHHFGYGSKDNRVRSWWGSVIDHNAQVLGSQGIPVEYLFG